jgi:hypothetical protein
MSWITPTANDVASEFTAREQSVIQSIQGAVSSNLPAILTRVVDEVREAIRAGGKPVDEVTTTTMPRGLVADAIAIARWRLLISMPQFAQLQTPVRKEEYDNALKKLELIAAGKRGVESPTGIGASMGGMIDTAQEGNSGNSREDLSRL